MPTKISVCCKSPSALSLFYLAAVRYFVEAQSSHSIIGNPSHPHSLKNCHFVQLKCAHFQP